MLRRKDFDDGSAGIDGSGSSLELKGDEIKALEAELPDLCAQLCLYLNSGLILSAALFSLADEYCRRDSPGAKLLKLAKDESVSKNISFETVLFEQAKTLRSRELLRLSMLLLDNSSKGSELCEKLERERQQKQKEKLSSAKAEAKMAETKLILPMMLLLIALVAICLAPAVINM
jgi:Flp pilus assembly protein TadB